MFRFYCNSAYKSFGIFNIAFSQAYKVQSVVNQVALAKRVGVNPGFRVRINSAHYRYGSMCIHSASVVQAAVAYISVLAATLKEPRLCRLFLKVFNCIIVISFVYFYSDK